jgi:hypothetical protein
MLRYVHVGTGRMPAPPGQQGYARQVGDLRGVEHQQLNDLFSVHHVHDVIA